MNTINNVLQYAQMCELAFTATMAESGYERKTTFFADLSIAEVFGAKELRKSFNKIVNEWKNNVVYFTEFVMCLNHKIWQHYKKNAELAKVYDDLWHKAARMAEDNFAGDDLNYYYRTTD